MNKKQTTKLAKALEEFLSEYFKQEQTKPKIEDHNFKIDSTGWKKIEMSGCDFLENPEGDIWEMINCEELNGEQLFTWDAAMRETKKAGKRMPTDEEWSKILKTKDDLPNIRYAGIRGTNGTYYSRSEYTDLWSSTEGAVGEAWNRSLSYTRTDVDRSDYSKAYAWSVRCLED